MWVTDDLVERSAGWRGGHRVCLDKFGNTVFEVLKITTRLDKTAFTALKEHSVQVVAPQQQVVVCWGGVSCLCVPDGDGSIGCREAGVGH